jgi:hypothetical protein
MLAACTWSRFLASYWPAGFETFLQVSAIASHWLEDVQIVHQHWTKMTNTVPATLSAIQTASQSTLITAQLYFTCDERE